MTLLTALAGRVRGMWLDLRTDSHSSSMHQSVRLRHSKTLLEKKTYYNIANLGYAISLTSVRCP